MPKAAGKKRVVAVQTVPTRDVPEPESELPPYGRVTRFTSGMKEHDEEIAVCIQALKSLTVSGKDKAAVDDVVARLRAMRGS